MGRGEVRMSPLHHPGSIVLFFCISAVTWGLAHLTRTVGLVSVCSPPDDGWNPLPRDQTPAPDRSVGLSRGADAMATVWADGFRVRPSVCQWPLGPSEVWDALADPRVDFTSSPLPVGIWSAPAQSINSLSHRSSLPVPTHFSPDFHIAFAGGMGRR